MAHTIAAGTLLAHRYLLVRELGVGGMGVVWEAETSGPSTVALKILHAKRGVDERAVARFRREALVLGWLDHPHIVRVLDAGESEHGPYIAMELVRGATMMETVRSGGALSRARAVRITRQVLAALSALHSVGVVHRDVKPGNVLLTRDVDGRDVAKLADLGAAHVASETRLTELGQAVGTPRYMAPEQLLGEPLSPRCDVYAVGALLHFMLLGEQPFTASDRELLLRAVLTGDRPKIRDRLPSAADLGSVVDAAMAVDASARPATAAAMDAALVPFDAEPAHSISQWMPRISTTTLGEWVATGEDPTRTLALGRAVLDAPAVATRSVAAFPEAPAAPVLPPPRRGAEAARRRIWPTLAVAAIAGAGGAGVTALVLRGDTPHATAPTSDATPPPVEPVPVVLPPSDRDASAPAAELPSPDAGEERAPRMTIVRNASPTSPSDSPRGRARLDRVEIHEADGIDAAVVRTHISRRFPSAAICYGAVLAPEPPPPWTLRTHVELNAAGIAIRGQEQITPGQPRPIPEALMRCIFEQVIRVPWPPRSGNASMTVTLHVTQ